MFRVPRFVSPCGPRFCGLHDGSRARSRSCSCMKTIALPCCSNPVPPGRARPCTAEITIRPPAPAFEGDRPAAAASSACPLPARSAPCAADTPPHPSGERTPCRSTARSAAAPPGSPPRATPGSSPDLRRFPYPWMLFHAFPPGTLHSNTKPFACQLAR